MKTIRGKRAMVTGAASGIGRAIAVRLAKEGANLFLVDIDLENLRSVVDEIRDCGVEVIVRYCDLSDASQISAAVGELRRNWPGLDILINNAGIAYHGPTHLMTAEEWRQIMSVNLLAPIQLVHELLPILLSSDDSHLLNVCSMFGLVSWHRIAAYQTSKFGLVGFTLALRAEYYSESFGVTALCPGFVNTPLSKKNAAIPTWACITPDRVAARTVRAIRRKQGLVVMTPFARGFWRMTRLLPGLASWLNRQGWRRRRKMTA
jgi:short-subunit dehydrogenase